MKQDGTLFTLENDELLVTVARRGAELTRIYDKKADREVLWCAEPSVWNRHAPVLRLWENVMRERMSMMGKNTA